MKIKKIGHCCLVIEVDGVKIMTDPGMFSTMQVEELNVNYILITHEHGDHVHVESLKKVLANNPVCKVITNTSVKKILDAEGIESTLLEEGELDISGINLFAKTCPHVDIYDGIIPVQNTGYMIAGRLFYPGDAWLEPFRKIEILAVPVAGPWNKIRDMMTYVLKVQPKVIFNVHDGVLNQVGLSVNERILGGIFASKGQDFRYLKEGESLEF